jgi:hypothetical protein
VDVFINEPPINGRLIWSGTEGLTLLTKFSGQLVEYQDPENDLPLTYGLSWVRAATYDISDVGKETSEYLLSGRVETRTFTVVLPYGALTVVGRCYDALGASAVATTHVTVRVLPDLLQIGELIAQATSTTDPWEALNLISAISFQLDYTNPGDV